MFVSCYPSRLRPFRVIRLVCVCPSNASASVVSVHLLRLSISCVSSRPSRLRPSRVVRFVCVCLSPASRLIRLMLSVSSRLRSHLLRLSPASISCVSSVLCVMCNSNSWIVYLSIHSNALKSISLKRLTGSTCLTGFECLECLECLKCLREFEGIKVSTHITP